jgi:hypothetical protein
MKRVWTVLHQKAPRTDAQRRWDQAYQFLLQSASPSTGAMERTPQATARACVPGSSTGGVAASTRTSRPRRSAAAMSSSTRRRRGTRADRQPCRRPEQASRVASAQAKASKWCSPAERRSDTRKERSSRVAADRKRLQRGIRSQPFSSVAIRNYSE